MNKLLVLATSLLLVGAGGPPSQDAPAAVVVKVEGSVQLQMGDGDPRPAAVGARLSVGDRVLPAAESRAIVVYRTGATRQVTEATTIEAPAGAAEGDMFSRTVGVLAQAANSDARSQPNRQGMIRPVPGAPEIISPRNLIKVLGPRPTFRWHPAEGMDGYIVQIRREGSPPVRYPVGSVTTWTLPESEEALVPGEVYWWTVGPSGRGRPSREMQFQLLGTEEQAAIDEQLALLTDSGLDPEGDGAFLATVVYREAGLLYDAARSLAFLEDAGIGLSADAYLLKGEIMDALGELEAAQEAFDQADKVMR
jgi:hypothetical protein